MLLSTDILLKFTLAVFLSGLIGWERERSNKPFGIRDAVLVGGAAALLTIIGLKTNSQYILGGIIIGVGFIGSGVITKEKKDIVGITTASVVWVVTAISMSVCMGFYIISILMTAIVYIVLLSKEMKNKLVKKKR